MSLYLKDICVIKRGAEQKHAEPHYTDMGSYNGPLYHLIGVDGIKLAKNYNVDTCIAVLDDFSIIERREKFFLVGGVSITPKKDVLDLSYLCIFLRYLKCTHNITEDLLKKIIIAPRSLQEQNTIVQQLVSGEYEAQVTKHEQEYRECDIVLNTLFVPFHARHLKKKFRFQDMFIIEHHDQIHSSRPIYTHYAQHVELYRRLTHNPDHTEESNVYNRDGEYLILSSVYDIPIFIEKQDILESKKKNLVQIGKDKFFVKYPTFTIRSISSKFSITRLFEEINITKFLQMFYDSSDELIETVDSITGAVTHCRRYILKPDHLHNSLIFCLDQKDKQLMKNRMSILKDTIEREKDPLMSIFGFRLKNKKWIFGKLKNKKN